MKTTIEAKLIISVEKNPCSMSVEIVNNDYDDVKTACFIKYLKNMLLQHAQPIVYSAFTLAELNEKIILSGIDEE